MQVSLKTSVCYAVFDGRLEPTDVDWNQTFVICESYDQTEELSEDEMYPIGKWHLVYQTEQDQTYLLYEFTAETIEDEPATGDSEESEEGGTDNE